MSTTRTLPFNIMIDHSELIWNSKPFLRPYRHNPFFWIYTSVLPKRLSPCPSEKQNPVPAWAKHHRNQPRQINSYLPPYSSFQYLYYSIFFQVKLGSRHFFGWLLYLFLEIFQLRILKPKTGQRTEGRKFNHNNK